MNNLSKTDEDKLIAQAAEGNEKATAILYHHYEGLLIKESRERYLAAMNLSDEAPGIARLAFYEAIKSYDATRGIHFAAYLQRQVRGTLYTEFKRQRRYLSRTTKASSSKKPENATYPAPRTQTKPPPKSKTSGMSTQTPAAAKTTKKKSATANSSARPSINSPQLKNAS